MAHTRRDADVLERAVKIALGATLAATIVLTGAVLLFRPGQDAADAVTIPGGEHDFQVEVLNSTQQLGLARSVTRFLRSQGVDVVYYGTAQDQGLDATRIVVRRGDSSAALMVREILGQGAVAVDHDLDLLLDVTVLLGVDFVHPLEINP